MLKGKLLALISGTTSVAVAATTALTLAISGPRDTYSLNALSDNDAISVGISNMFDSASSGVDTVTEVLDTLSSDKAALSLGFNINEIKDLEELSGLGGNLDINIDYANKIASIDADAVYGTVELFNAILYYEHNKEMAISAPTFFNGIIKLGLDNLEDDFKNSYIGSLLKAQGMDIEDFKKEFEEIFSAAEATSTLPEFEYDFDYEEFAEELSDVMDEGFKTAMKNMGVTDNGLKSLNGGKYQSYTAAISVEDLSNIVKDGIVFVLESKDFQGYIDYLMKYMETVQGDISSDLDDFGSMAGGMISGDISYGQTLGSLAPMLETYWPSIVLELEKVLGKNIEFTIYLTDTVETAGFEFYASMNSDGSINYKKNAVTGAEAAVVLKGDFTGGKNTGDYSYLSIEALEFGESMVFGEYSLKMEPDGDFKLSLVMNEEDEQVCAINISGKYVTNDIFFTLDVDSFKFTEENEEIFDVGFKISFQPIDKVVKPSGSKEYDLWKMDEAELKELFENLSENAEKIEDVLDDILR